MATKNEHLDMFTKKLNKILTENSIRLPEKNNFSDVMGQYFIDEVMKGDRPMYDELPEKIITDFNFDATDSINQINKNTYLRIATMELFLYHYPEAQQYRKINKSGLSLHGSKFRGWFDNNRSF